MIPSDISSAAIKLLFVLVLGTTAYIATRRNINSLFLTYAAQSLFIALIALSLFMTEHTMTLLWIAVLTIISKVMIIPLFMKKLQKEMKIKRDVEFHYVSAVGSIFVSVFIILLIYVLFSRLIRELSPDSMFLLGATLGISLLFIGMMIIFSRKKAITKIIGYLTMENGVLLFSMFFPELPFIIEFLITIDLIILILISVMLAFGVDSTIEAFHDKINPFMKWMNEDEYEDE